MPQEDGRCSGRLGRDLKERGAAVWNKLVKAREERCEMCASTRRPGVPVDVYVYIRVGRPGKNGAGKM